MGDLPQIEAIFGHNYNPTLGLGNLLRKNGKAVGLVMLQYEHESNGRDSIWSRSWNRISLLGQIFSRNWSMEVKLWAPFRWTIPTATSFITTATGSWQPITKSDNERLWLSACITKRGGWNLNANTELEVAWRAIRKCNLYLTLQYYNGYGEGLLPTTSFTTTFASGSSSNRAM